MIEAPTIDGTDLSVPRLVLGTMTFGAPVDRDTAREMVDVAADAGVTMLDTANGYADGESERILADVLAGRRDQFTIATKAGIGAAEAAGRPPLSPGALKDALHASLKRLGTDRVDLFYLHKPDRETPAADTVGAVGELIAEGSVRYWGVSNYAAWQIAELRDAADVLGVPQPVATQPIYNLIARRIEDEYVEYTQRTGLVNIVYNPLGGGLLTGKHSFERPEQDGRFGDAALGTMYRQRYWNAELFAAVDALGTIAADAGMSLVELSLRWLLARPATGAVLLGGSRVEHLRANIEAAAGAAPDEAVMAACDEVWARLYGPAPKYNR